MATLDAFFTGGSKTKPAVNEKKTIADIEQKLPWVEKYRPHQVDDIIYQDDAVAFLHSCLNGVDLPHMLFYGPPGTGKTSAALALCRQLFGTTYRDRVLEMNASDERGIQIVRSKIKDFARLAVGSSRSDGKSCPPVKIIVLDEADSMTSAAQAALRRTMEKESKTTRFILICNYISRIIDPLTSRCVKFRFKSLNIETQRKRLLMISAAENVNITDDAIDQLIDVCEGDLRKSITYLQSVASSYRRDSPITVADIDSMTGVVPINTIHYFLAACRSGKYETVQDAVQIKRDGYPAYHFMTRLFDVLMTNNDFQDECKAAIFDKLALCEYRLLDGADEYLQMMDLSCVILAQYKLS